MNARRIEMDGNRGAGTVHKSKGGMKRVSSRLLPLTNPIPDIPQPASLGILALGAQGVPLWRRKESGLEGD
jgi:hypothetical protein